MFLVRAAVLRRGVLATGPGALAHSNIRILITDIPYCSHGLPQWRNFALLRLIYQFKVSNIGTNELSGSLPGDDQVVSDLVRAEVEGTNVFGMEVSHRGGSKGIIEVLQREDAYLRGRVQQEGISAANRNQRERVSLLPHRVQQKEGIRAVVSRVPKRKSFVAKGLSARAPTTGHRCAIRRGILEKAPYVSDTLIACCPVVVDIHNDQMQSNKLISRPRGTGAHHQN